MKPSFVQWVQTDQAAGDEGFPTEPPGGCSQSTETTLLGPGDGKDSPSESQGLPGHRDCRPSKPPGMSSLNRSSVGDPLQVPAGLGQKEPLGSLTTTQCWLPQTRWGWACSWGLGAYPVRRPLPTHPCGRQRRLRRATAVCRRDKAAHPPGYEVIEG